MEVEYIKNYYPNLLSWKDFENIINLRPLLTSSRVKVDGNYEWKNSAWAADPNCFPISIIKNLFDEHIFYIRDMSRCNKKINLLSKKLEEEYKLCVDAHIFICRNPDLKHPFGIHFDVNDNVIVQCEGETNFKVWDIVQDKNQISNNLILFNSPILDVTLVPGDAIKIPAYYPHLASSLTKRLSVSFPMWANGNNENFEEREWFEFD